MWLDGAERGGAGEGGVCVSERGDSSTHVPRLRRRSRWHPQRWFCRRPAPPAVDRKPPLSDTRLAPCTAATMSLEKTEKNGGKQPKESELSVTAAATRCLLGTLTCSHTIMTPICFLVISVFYVEKQLPCVHFNIKYLSSIYSVHFSLVRISVCMRLHYTLFHAFICTHSGRRASTKNRSHQVWTKNMTY